MIDWRSWCLFCWRRKMRKRFCNCCCLREMGRCQTSSGSSKGTMCWLRETWVEAKPADSKNPFSVLRDAKICRIYLPQMDAIAAIYQWPQKFINPPPLFRRQEALNIFENKCPWFNPSYNLRKDGHKAISFRLRPFAFQLMKNPGKEALRQ